VVVGGGGLGVCDGGGGGGRAGRHVAEEVGEGGGGRCDALQIAVGREGGHEQERAPETEGSRTRTARTRKSIQRPMRKRTYG